MAITIPLVPDKSLFDSGITKYISWDYKKNPHMVIFGSTGSGKTYLLKIILGRISKYIEDSELIVCDFKADDDFSFLSGSANFYRFSECSKGLEKAVEILHMRQRTDSLDRHFVALVFDEWASFLNHLDKKSAEKAKQDLSTLLMLGRSFGIHVILSQQRLDASYFGSSRDNFSIVIGMGTLSKESVQMMFSDFKEEINACHSQGFGSLLIEKPII